ncbi:ABC transporter ATP-binding protein [Rhodothermus profundi]|uniref:ABC-2 type transport system ATP-binding protein n=1 Tax=Rhodothermus profundi TaxID=633813 RepID=A0A1M6Q4E0_9BACT|nr:ABC transporter ATP-binding protein [Rhodothermus profundi]SHK14983.1 ABC-2 type transport system ATP-binding protein [Rhodothermus profundi]
MPEAAVTIEDLTFRYGSHTALRSISLHIPAGCCFGLLGPNGSGKTTLMRLLATLLSPTSGRLQVCGYDPVQAPDAVRRCLGVVFQQPALDGDLTVEENLRLHGAFYGLRGPALTRRIDELLERFGLQKRRRELLRRLSGGQQRRVDLMRGLLHRPQLLLLDEPTTGLDPLARHTFWQTLRQLRQTDHLTLIVATHLLEEAELCDQVALLDEGRLVATGAPDLLARELGEEVLWLETSEPETIAAFIQTHFGLEARVIGASVRVAASDAHALLPRLYEALGSRLRSATVRRPTLEDVFLIHTGHHLHPAAHATLSS